jgi:non-heme chloroperoxidase
MVHRVWQRASLLISLLMPLNAQPAPVWRDPSPHQIQFVTVETNVQLEVFDWGGSGLPVVLLAGTNTAHIFDDFAPKLAADCHVYGITRRGFGASSIPASGYGPDRLGDDVIAVLDALKINQSVLVGHAFGGMELSSVGSRHPGRVAGLVYLEAAYPYAFDNGKGVTIEDLLKRSPLPPQPLTASDQASFPALRAWYKRVNGIAFPEAEVRNYYFSEPDGSVGKAHTTVSAVQAINTGIAGLKKVTEIRSPALAIFAIPRDERLQLANVEDPAVRAAAEAFFANYAVLQEKQAQAFSDGVPGSRVVRLRNANHYVFLSNEADVLREMRGFLATLK